MKIRLPLITTALLTLLVVGCGKKETATAAATPAAAPAAPAAPAGPRVVEITANDSMKFSLAAIDAKVGEQLKIVFTNTGSIPKEAMGHNFVVLKAGSDVAAFAAASSVSKETDYIAPALKDQVLGHTAILGPRKTEELLITFSAAGEYPFLCSFPAHFAVGMKGIVSVK